MKYHYLIILTFLLIKYARLRVKQIIFVDGAKYSKKTSTFCPHKQQGKIANEEAHNNDNIQSEIELLTCF